MLKSHSVTLLNQKLVVRSEDSEEYVARISEYVEAKIQEVTGRSKGTSTLTAALLVGLNIADELFRTQALQKVENSKLAERVRDLVDLIETHLDQGGLAPVADVLMSEQAL